VIFMNIHVILFLIYLPLQFACAVFESRYAVA
jgi:hypothetical protein